MAVNGLFEDKKIRENLWQERPHLVRNLLCADKIAEDGNQKRIRSHLKLLRFEQTCY
jgi:hypothetical protein